MNILSINICGTGCAFKLKRLNHILWKNKVNFLCLQESKMADSDLFRVKNIWGNYQFGYVESLANGRSGGILSIWDPNSFELVDSVIHENFVIVKGKWIATSFDCYIINIYAPQGEREKVELWNKIVDFMNNNSGNYVLCGDFNSVRCEDERMGSSFSRSNANNFKDFISRGHLVDLKTGRHKFTRISPNGLKASRLDRFLINNSAMGILKDILVEALDDVISDHRPIIFKQKSSDFGPSPFKLYNSWLSIEGFGEMIKDNWGKEDTSRGNNAFYALKNKLKAIKLVIKQWNQERSKGRNRDSITREIADVDLLLSSSARSVDLVTSRENLIRELREFNLRESKDLQQKAKVKWATEGDENSKFFHAIINAKRKSSRINGVKHNGVWIEQPDEIKSCFRNYFANKFKHFEGAQFSLNHSAVKSLSSTDAEFLDSQFSLQEIKDAVWCCGGDKAPGPDGFSFEFVKQHWDVLKNDVINMVHEFYEKAHIPTGCNSSFITLIPKVSSPLIVSDYRPINLIGAQYKIISKLLANRLVKVLDSIISTEQSAFIKGRQILDGPFIINELIEWHKVKKKRMMLFKIDFAKAYDSLSWEYLFYMLDIMGFGKRWISWIKACLNSARASILVNGSPTEEFDIRRGLRQGDPMAPFLFIIAMEGLHLAIDNLVNSGVFSGVRVNQVPISHLFYADDVMITGEWDEKNLMVISNAFKFFYSISGLKINFLKSSIIGIGVSEIEVARFASLLGCKKEKLPFKYLGIPIGGSPKRLSFWEPIINKFKKRLSNWKASLLSIGGRTTLIKSVLGSIGIYFLSLFPMPKGVNKKLEALRASFFWGGSHNNRKLHWCKWDSVLASVDNGGIGIGSLLATNVSLLYKWRWRGLNCVSSLWAKIISAIHGYNCFSSMVSKSKGPWANLVEVFKTCHVKYKLPKEVIVRKIGNGIDTRFWKDVWCGDKSFDFLFPRIFALEVDKNCSVASRLVLQEWSWNWRRDPRAGHELNQLQQLSNLLPRSLENGADSWLWQLQGNKSFASASIRIFIDNKICAVGRATCWNKLIPKKINIFVWRMLRNAIPTFLNLFGRGIDVATVNCKLCNNGIDDGTHLFQQCNHTCGLRKHLSNWFQLDIPALDPRGVMEWCKTLATSKHNRCIVESITFVWWWHIWKDRNNIVHKKEAVNIVNSLQSITSLSYLWITNRDRKRQYDWNAWMRCPLDHG